MSVFWIVGIVISSVVLSILCPTNGEESKGKRNG